MSMVMGSGFGIGMDMHGPGPEFLCPCSREVDGGCAVHSRCLSGIGVEFIARHHADALVLPAILWWGRDWGF